MNNMVVTMYHMCPNAAPSRPPLSQEKGLPESGKRNIGAGRPVRPSSPETRIPVGCGRTRNRHPRRQRRRPGMRRSMNAQSPGIIPIAAKGRPGRHLQDSDNPGAGKSDTPAGIPANGHVPKVREGMSDPTHGFHPPATFPAQPRKGTCRRSRSAQAAIAPHAPARSGTAAF